MDYMQKYLFWWKIIYSAKKAKITEVLEEEKQEKLPREG